ncbi:MAG TPA: protein YgfX [Gammaproteobacteria bacterium]|nr:protein YgfX [Gammaproteobacteria bacterium]
MSSTPYAAPLRLDLGPSLLLIGLLAAGHGAALVVAAAAPVALWVRGLLALAALGSAMDAWRRCLAPMLGAPLELVWDADGVWRIRWQGHWQPARLSAPAHVRRHLVLFTLVLKDGCRVPVVVLPDRLDPDSFRRLRVRLKLEAGGPRGHWPEGSGSGR